MPSAAEIADALDRLVGAAHRQRAVAAATRPDVNATDLLALDIVRRSGRIAPGALARAMHLTPGGTNGVIRRVLKAKLLIRQTASSDHRDVGLEVTRRGEHLMTTAIGGWDPKLLERLARRKGDAATDMMHLLATIAEATEARSDEFAIVAAQLASPAGGVPIPLRWG